MAKRQEQAAAVTISEHAEAMLQLARSRAIVDLVRHYLEWEQLEDQLNHREITEGVRALPPGALWPGEVDRQDVVRALYGAWGDIAAVQKVLSRLPATS